MGILSSLNTGITGLKAQGEALGVYGDNIANANTYGFKTSRPEFSDVVSKSLKGMLGGNQIGSGTSLSAINPVFSQGSLIQTDSTTDVAISGNGFFVLDGLEGRSFTRNGAFHFDKDGKLINADNYQLLGFKADEEGKVTSKLGPISVERTVIDAKKTSKVQLFANLDLRQVAKPEFNIERPDDTSNFATGTVVYDSAGSPHTVTVYFNKLEDGKWQWRALAKGEEVNGGEKGKLYEQASGKLKFDTDGRLMESSTDKSEFNFNNGALPGQEVIFDFGQDKASGGTGMQVTQYGSDSEVYRALQDGMSVGVLTGLTFNDDGTLSSVYSNGKTLAVAQLAVAKFENPEGLYKMGQNRFRESRLSGEAVLGAPGSGGRGKISPKSIEQSTTDLATEFVNLMTAQRNFQANAKVVNTADQMLTEILNLKRN